MKPSGQPPTPPAAPSDAGTRGARKMHLPAPVLQGGAAVMVAVLVALASQGTPVWTELRDGQADRAQVLDRVAELGALGLIAAAAITLLFHFTVVARRPGSPPLRRTLVRALPVTALALSFVALLTIARAGRSPEPPPGGGAMQLEWFSGLGIADDPLGGIGGEAEAESPGTGEDAAPTEPTRFDPVLLMLLAATAAALAGAWLWWSHRKSVGRSELVAPAEEQPAGGEAIEVRETLLGTIEAMLADPDPRKAIIGAYARLLTVLAACDLPRREHEAPLEHLQRALAQLRVSADPLRTLARLFELARFSTHPLTEVHRQQALQALRSASEDLQRASRAGWNGPAHPATSSAR